MYCLTVWQVSNLHRQDVVNKTFLAMMGTDSLTAKNLPGYPAGIGITMWPKDQDTGFTYLRFNWAKPSSRRNTEYLQQIFANIRSMGAQRVPAAKLGLAQISDDDLKDKIKQRFGYMASEVKKLQKAEEAEEERQRQIEDLEIEEEDEEKGQKALKRSQKNARAEAVSSVSPPQKLRLTALPDSQRAHSKASQVRIHSCQVRFSLHTQCHVRLRG